MTQAKLTHRELCEVGSALLLSPESANGVISSVQLI